MNVFERNSEYQPGQLVPGEGAYGIGGGVMVDVAPDAIVAQNTFEGNYAVRTNGEGNTSWGSGGGLTAIATDRLRTRLKMSSSRMWLIRWAGPAMAAGLLRSARHKSMRLRIDWKPTWRLVVGPNGQGGGMYLNGSENMATADWQVINNEVISNVAVFQLTDADNTYCAGGGLRLWISVEAENGQHSR